MRTEGFLEVDTPVLRYFEDPTHNPLFYTAGPNGWPRLHLRTCPEEYTRRCACVLNKAFEVAKCFRNEKATSNGNGLLHLPEFTMLEAYEVDADLEAALRMIETLVRTAVTQCMGTSSVMYQENSLDFSRPFRRVRVLDALLESGAPEAKQFVEKHRVAEPVLIPGEPQVLQRLLDAHVKPMLVQPSVLTHFPRSADYYPDRAIGNEMQRGEFVVAGIEAGEVAALHHDADHLQKHISSAITSRHGAHAAPQLLDVDYIEEIRAFGRPVGGGAIGIDRLLMVLCNSTDIREVVWYPSITNFY